jgi:regulation of enolase protein 1 (concanavalin A-like superfamily)
LRAGRIAPADEAGEILFHDSFRGQLGSGWRWIREDRANWRATDQGLEVRVQPGNMWGPANDAHNLLVRDAPDVDHQTIRITASVENHPTHQYEQVDLVWYYTDGNMVKIGEELVDGRLSIVMGREQNDRTRTIKIIPLDSPKVQLRLIVSGSHILGRFKTPQGDWRDVGGCDLPVKGEPKISLQFYQGAPDVEHWAHVTDFSIARMP